MIARLTVHMTLSMCARTFGILSCGESLRSCVSAAAGVYVDVFDAIKLVRFVRSIASGSLLVAREPFLALVEGVNDMPRRSRLAIRPGTMFVTTSCVLAHAPIACVSYDSYLDDAVIEAITNDCEHCIIRSGDFLKLELL